MTSLQESHTITREIMKQLVSIGSDLRKPMVIEFHVDLQDEDSAGGFLQTMQREAFDCELSFDDETGRWTCTCAREMLLTFDGIRENEIWLDELAAPFNGHVDGWGTFGNARPGLAGWLSRLWTH